MIQSILNKFVSDLAMEGIELLKPIKLEVNLETWLDISNSIVMDRRFDLQSRMTLEGNINNDDILYNMGYTQVIISKEYAQSRSRIAALEKELAYQKKLSEET